MMGRRWSITHTRSALLQSSRIYFQLTHPSEGPSPLSPGLVSVRGVHSPFPARSGKIKDRLRLHFSRTILFCICQNWTPDFHFMPNLEIQHVFIALEPQHQRLRRLERRRARSIGSSSASPVRDLKSGV